jgi:hypothetical protein
MGENTVCEGKGRLNPTRQIQWKPCLLVKGRRDFGVIGVLDRMSRSGFDPRSLIFALCPALFGW